MIDRAGIFKNRVLAPEKLLGYGFAPCERGYQASFEIAGGQFVLRVLISAAGLPEAKVFDRESGEEYAPVYAPGAGGSFVGTVIEACEERLKSIAEACYRYEVFQSQQAKMAIAYVERAYHDQLEFLWAKLPDCAIVRRRDTAKWYAAILTVAKEKIGLPGKGKIEVIDLRESPEQVEKLVDGKRFFPGYHMNKRHWYTIVLDGTVPDEELCRHIDDSFLLAIK